MKAAVLFESPGRLQITDVTLDDPQSSEVVVDIRAAGLCASDLHWLKRPMPLERPTILGHEGAGVVSKVGSGVTYVKPGDHVVLFAVGACGQCEWCLSGRGTLCDQSQMIRPHGAPPRAFLDDGTECEQYAGTATFAEQTLVHENMLVKVDKDVPFDRAALLGCAIPTGVGAVTRTARVAPGDTVAVVGCGGVGLNCIQGAVLAGAERIFAIDVNAGKLEQAKAFGATDLINSSTVSPREAIDAVLPGRNGVDYAFEAIGKPQTFDTAFSLIRPSGAVVVIGVSEETYSFPARAMLSEKRILGSYMGSVRFRQDIPFLLDMYRAGRLKLDELVSNTVTLAGINEGYDAITSGEIARSVVVFD
ncbi:Zn-dependent alcohol dehydrogenase [Rhodococcus koreensis]